MTLMKSTFHELFDLTFGRQDPAPAEGARQQHRVLAAVLASLAFAALYGLAAGSRSVPLMLGNLYKLPMIVLLSTVCAIPAGALAWKLSGTRSTLTEVLTRHVGAVLAGTAVLLVLAPLLAVYYQTSAWAGPILAVGASCVAVLVALVQAVRKTLAATPEGASRVAALLPVAVLGVVQLAALLQLIALAAPIVPEATAFRGGLDGFFDAH